MHGYASGWSGNSPDRGLARLYVGVLFPLLILYTLTAQRGPAWQDSGAFQWRIFQFELSSQGGLALSHPLMIVLGRVFLAVGAGPPAWRMNLLSVLCAAVAAANVAALVRRLCPARPAAAWLAGGFFALAHTTWWTATIIESQALLAALLTAELHVLVSLCRRPRPGTAALLGLVAGLGLSAHNMALLSLPIYALVVLSLCLAGRLAWRAVPVMALAWMAGASLYLGMVAHAAARWGWGDAIHSALFGGQQGTPGWQASVWGGSWDTARQGLSYVVYNFPNLALVLAPLGLLRSLRALPGRLGLALAGLTVLHLGFALTYRVPDQFMFFTSSYALLAVLAGLALGGPPASARPGRRWVTALALLTLAATPVLYAAAPHLVQRAGLSLPTHHEAPGRDPLRYWLVPWKNDEESAEQFARAALRQAPPGSVIIADSSSVHPLRLVQATTRLGPQVEIVPVAQATPQTVPPGAVRAYVVSDKPGRRPDWLARTATLPPRSNGQVLIDVIWHADRSTTQPGQ